MLLVCLLVSAVNCSPALVSFSFGVFNLVFWLLTYCQCPFPCGQYQGGHGNVTRETRDTCGHAGMCSAGGGPYLACWDSVLVWSWPALSLLGLVSRNISSQ